MTTAGAKLLASWLAGNPPLQKLYINSKFRAVVMKLEGVWMTMLALWQAIVTLATTG